jgi:hypothetical protein
MWQYANVPTDSMGLRESSSACDKTLHITVPTDSKGLEISKVTYTCSRN